VVEAEQEVAAPPPSAQAEVEASGGPPLPQGPTAVMIDLTSDDPPSDKGKQKADVEMVDATDWPATSTAPSGDTARRPLGG
jgi:hypothetical protein